MSDTSQGTFIRRSIKLFRRICPGRHFAELSLWAAMVVILSTIRITTVKDSKGIDIPVIPEHTNGLAMLVVRSQIFSAGLTFLFDSHPKPFACAITSINSRREEHMRAVSRVE